MQENFWLQLKKYTAGLKPELVTLINIVFCKKFFFFFNLHWQMPVFCLWGLIQCLGYYSILLWVNLYFTYWQLNDLEHFYHSSVVYATYMIISFTFPFALSVNNILGQHVLLTTSLSSQSKSKKVFPGIQRSILVSVLSALVSLFFMFLVLFQLCM